MRGCFRDRYPLKDELRVLPAYAGMFPLKFDDYEFIDSSPRVCGDVSVLDPKTHKKTVFSPRMRGCFRLWPRKCALWLVLPAYAGMFLEVIRTSVAHEGSPRVCGDVSTERHAAYTKSWFSPRMRGCFRPCVFG